MNAERRHLVVFARRPALGAGKRRLAADLGACAALRFQRYALARLQRTLGADARWTYWQSLTPDRYGQSEPRVLHQGRGDLGARLTHVARTAPAGALVIIGSDAPQISSRDIAAAFCALGRVGAVFGPALDGGFWLVGLAPAARRRPPFARVRWSSPYTLDDVLANLRGQDFALLRPLEDVDDGPSLRRVLGRKPA